MKKVVGMVLHTSSSRRADTQPIQPEGITAGDPVLAIERQEVGERLLLAAIKYVALEFGDNQREARDLCREVAQFDAAKIGERDVAVALALAAPAVTAFNFGGFGKKTSAPKPAQKSSGGAYPSVALPWTTTNLDGSLVGDVGFDPLGFSKYAPGAWWVGDEGDGSLKIFREAELMHGRIAQLACLGWVFPELAHFPGKDGAFGKMNPFEAVDAIPNAGWYQILAFMASLEVYRVNKLKDPSYVPGDLSLGQGPGRWNPFGFDYTPEEYAEKQLQEIKHCRLAMLGIIGLAAKSSGAGDVGVLAMLGGGKPEFVTKAGFYFPEGI